MGACSVRVQPSMIASNQNHITVKIRNSLCGILVEDRMRRENMEPLRNTNTIPWVPGSGGVVPVENSLEHRRSRSWDAYSVIVLDEAKGISGQGIRVTIKIVEFLRCQVPCSPSPSLKSFSANALK